MYPIGFHGFGLGRDEFWIGRHDVGDERVNGPEAEYTATSGKTLSGATSTSNRLIGMGPCDELAWLDPLGRRAGTVVEKLLE